MSNVREYYTPTSVVEIMRLIADTAHRNLILAGGTRLIGELETGLDADVDGVIDLRQLGLASISVNDDNIVFGAMATLSDVLSHEVAGSLAGGLLRRAAFGEGPLNLRNAATVGGTVATAATDSEFYAALLALNASVEIAGSDGVAVTPLVELGSLNGLITSVLLPIADGRSGLARVARTPSDRPIVAAVAVNDDSGERVALCGVAGRPVLDGTPLDPPLDPPDDFKGSAEYRRKMAPILAERALKEARGSS